MEKTLKKVKEKIRTVSIVDSNSQVININNVEPIVTPHISLPYNGKRGQGIVQNFKKYLKGALPERVKPRFTYKGTRLGSFFRVKDNIKWEHESNLVYHYGCQFSEGYTCNNISEYVGETNVRMGTRSHEHINKASAVFDHLRSSNHDADNSNFKILARGYDKYKDRKIAEALYIKDIRPNLNTRVKSHKLELFV